MADTRTVLTTGANSGIGLATVVEVARRGLRSVGSVRSDEKAATVHAAAAEADVEVETVLLDVTDAVGCAEVIDAVRPDGVVNNAGYPVIGAIEDVDDDEARAALETMVIGPMRLARLALPHLRRRGGGRIVQVSSVSGRVTTPLNGWYHAAKHALEAASDALRMEVARDGVHVSIVEPGGVSTALWDDFADALEERRLDSRYADAYQRTRERMWLNQPLMSDPQHVARVIVGALTQRWPRARYLVGLDARLGTATASLLPTAVLDRASRAAVGL